jgi:hypothetical protein
MKRALSDLHSSDSLKMQSYWIEGCVSLSTAL